MAHVNGCELKETLKIDHDGASKQHAII